MAIRLKPPNVLLGASSTLVSEAVGRGAAMAFQLLVANQLGASGYGLVALALASAAIPCTCLLYTSDAADDMQCVDLGGRRVIKKKKKRITSVCTRQQSQHACRCNQVSLTP
eukprot:TRINITY_DN17118_c0_g1_i1.p2 TRINITY_DN17118_c0_g1~~TRINITY_DN17118_c0_g1_i1.p2  ORF type:complete len:112 (+),score=4.66 TRINITY_DN17118_c0_g1_i1:561-896(+)